MRGTPPDRTVTHVPEAHARNRHLFAVFTAFATLGLIFMGGLVTSTGSGLAVPDWPLSYGMLMPPMVGGVFFEHGHRMAASGVGALTVVLALWTSLRERRPGARRLAWAALGLVVAQGVLGGITVLLLLPTSVSVAHACLAQAFFCVMIAVAYGTSPEWLRPGERTEDRAGLRGAAAAATGAVFVQLFLGALMRHMGAGLAIPDFPLLAGRLPSFQSPGVVVHFSHRVVAVFVLAFVLRLVLRVLRTRDQRFIRPVLAVLGLVLVQLGLGIATVLTAKSVVIATTHVAVGAAILGGCWLLTLRAWRLTDPGARPRAAVVGYPAATA